MPNDNRKELSQQLIKHRNLTILKHWEAFYKQTNNGAYHFDHFIYCTYHDSNLFHAVYFYVLFQKFKSYLCCNCYCGRTYGCCHHSCKTAGKKFSKKALCTYPFLAGIITTGIITFVKFTNPYIWLVFVAVAVLSAGLYMVLIWAMVADSIDYQEKKNRQA